MERIIRIFDSHAAAELSDRAELAAMEPQARLDMLLEAMRRHRERLGEAENRFERVCLVVDLPPR